MNPSLLCPSDLTQDEASAISRYKSADSEPGNPSHCYDLNRQLEHGLFPDEMGELGCSVSALDAVFSRTPKLKKEMIVYRGMGTRRNYPFSETGKRFRNLAFWSTSTHRHVAESFLKAPAPGSHGALLILTLPISLPVLGIGNSSDHEREILLPRGICWTVTSCKLIACKDLPRMVACKFANVAEVTLTAAPSWRAPR